MFFDFECFDVAKRHCIYPSIGRDLTAKIQDAIDIVHNDGGGVVYLKPGVWNVDSAVDGTAISMKSNVELIGAGRGATQLRWCGGDGHLLVATGISNWAVRRMSLHGGLDAGLATAGYHVIRGAAVDDFVLDDLFIEQSIYYGIGFQDGAITNGRVSRLHLKDTGSDAIDFKNKDGNANWGLIVSDIVVENFDLNGNGTKAAIDIRGPVTVSNVFVRSAFTADSIGIRLRHGESVDDNGEGGHYSAISNFIIEDTGSKLGSGVNIAARSAQVANGTVINCGSGVWASSAAEDSQVSNVSAKGCTNGFFIDGTRNAASDCRAKDCVTGYRLGGTDNGVRDSRSRGASSRGFYTLSTAVNPRLIDNESSNDATALLDSSATTVNVGNIGF